MHRNYCFRRKQHSYAACDAALAASLFLTVEVYFVTLRSVCVVLCHKMFEAINLVHPLLLSIHISRSV